MADVYITCPDCTHTTNIHGDKGCNAHKCECKTAFTK